MTGEQDIHGAPPREAAVDLLSGWIARQASPDGAAWFREAFPSVASGEEWPLAVNRRGVPMPIGAASNL